MAAKRSVLTASDFSKMYDFSQEGIKNRCSLRLTEPVIPDIEHLCSFDSVDVDQFVPVLRSHNYDLNE